MSFKRALSASAIAAGIGIPDCSVSALERPVQILGGATVQVLHHAVTIETTVARPLSTGTVAASTRADLTTSRSTGWVSR